MCSICSRIWMRSCGWRSSDFDFNTYVRLLSDFANEDLSAFFFDIRKDSLYCDAADRPQAPRLSHGARHPVPRHGALCRAGAGVYGEEVWGTRFPDAGSVHLLGMARAAATSSPRA